MEIENLVDELHIETDIGKTYDDFRKVCSREWSREIFKRVVNITEDLMASPWEQDPVSNTTCELNITKDVLKRFRERYSGIEEPKEHRTVVKCVPENGPDKFSNE